MRMDDLDEVDPFGLSNQTHPGPSGGLRRHGAAGAVLLSEAIELAHGRRHLTIVHGDPQDIAASRHLSEFYEAAVSARCRVRVGPRPWQRRVRHRDCRWSSRRRVDRAVRGCCCFRESGRLDDCRHRRAVAQLTVVEVRCDRSSL